MSNAQDGAMLSPQATQIETFTGAYVDVFDPDPATIDMLDIAHHLSMQARYNGAIKTFYSIAEHSILVMQLAGLLTGPNVNTKVSVGCGALLHDASETYLGDMVSPAKYALRQYEWQRDKIKHAPTFDHFRSAYDDLTDRMDAAICRSLDFDQEWLGHKCVVLADMWALKIEAEVLTHSGGANWRWLGDLPNDGKLPPSIQWYGGLHQLDAKAFFLDAVEKIGLWNGSHV